jgi:hypothetical protein
MDASASPPTGAALTCSGFAFTVGEDLGMIGRRGCCGDDSTEHSLGAVGRLGTWVLDK